MNSEPENKLDEKVRRLYQSLPPEQPPAELDAHILAAAHEGMQASARPVHSARMLHWQRKHKTVTAWKSLAYAAVLVLCVSVVLRMQTETGTPVPEPASIVTDEAPMALSPQAIAPAAESAAIVSEPVSVRLVDEQEKVMAESARKQQAESIAEEIQAEQLRMEQMRVSGDAIEKRDTVSKIAAGVSAVSAPISLDESGQPGDGRVDPESEVALMLKLLEEKKYPELDTALKVFIERNPDYLLPGPLKGYMEKRL